MGLWLLSFFSFYFVTSLLVPLRWRWNWFFIVSVLCLYNVNDSYLLLGLGLILINEAIKFLCRKNNWTSNRYLPLLYCFILIGIHELKGSPIVGGSYIILAASLDLVLGFNKIWDKGFLKETALNLMAFPKSSMGPIQSSADHLKDTNRQVNYPKTTHKIVLGTLKLFILLPLFRAAFTTPFFQDQFTVLNFLGFGLWNYIILFLEFSGICDMVMACFFVAGLNCNENFNQPYLCCSITDFWKRWHATLGHWIRQHVYIAFGGNRAGTTRLYLNLFLAMLICGLWHGVTWNYVLWGGLQGLFMIFERMIDWEKKIGKLQGPMKTLPWLVTQTLVVISWSVFFNWSSP